jgi:hypothetical protein
MTRGCGLIRRAHGVWNRVVAAGQGAPEVLASTKRLIPVEAKLTGMAVGFPGLVGVPVVAAGQGAPEVLASTEWLLLVEAKLTGLRVGFPDLVGAQVVAAAQGAPEAVASPENFMGV